MLGDLDHFTAKSANIDYVQPWINRIWPASDQLRPTFAGNCPRIEQHWLHLARNRPNSGNIGRFDQHWPGIAAISLGIDKHWPESESESKSGAKGNRHVSCSSSHQTATCRDKVWQAHDVASAGMLESWISAYGMRRSEGTSDGTSGPTSNSTSDSNSDVCSRNDYTATTLRHRRRTP